MSYTDRLRDKIEAAEKKAQEKPAFQMPTVDAWKFECALREELKTLRERCINKVLNEKTQ